MAVLCPRRMQVLEVVECRRCDHSRGLSLDPAGRELFLRCDWQRGKEDDAVFVAAGRDVVATIMSAPPTCLAESADASAALGLLLERDLGAVPVVDGDGRAVGIVTKNDLLGWQDERGDATDVETAGLRAPGVRELMSHVVFEVHAEAEISRAAALMAYEGVHHVVVTSAEGRAVGIVSALDVMGWLARACGYVVQSHLTEKER